MNVACDIVDISFVYNDFRVPAFNEMSSQYSQFCILVNGINFSSWYNAIAYFDITES